MTYAGLNGFFCDILTDRKEREIEKKIQQFSFSFTVLNKNSCTCILVIKINIFADIYKSFGMLVLGS
jgi:hypothetical protein